MEICRLDQQHGRQGNDYQNVTVAEGSRAVLGNIYAESFSMNVLDPQRPRQTEQDKKEEFLKSLRFDVMDSRLATISFAHRDTCSWLFTRAEYLRWQDPESRALHHGFLWIKGKPGAGKSTLMKHALHHAQGLGQRNTTVLSFFFSARGHELEKTTEGMYRSLLHQVYKSHPDRLPDVLLNVPSGSKNYVWQLPILQSMLREALLNFGNTAQFICYIDALDECNEDAIRLAIEYFEELGDRAISRGVKISVCFASRHYPNITMRRYQTLNLDDQREHLEDIENCVRGRLRSTGITQLTHAQLTEEISRRSSGVFLWAVLVVQILNKQTDRGADRSQLMAHLKTVPSGIEDLLRSILLDGGHQSEFLLPTLQWVLFSFRPLSESALYLAINAGAGCSPDITMDHNETTLERMRLFILNSSKGLVEFSKAHFAKAQFIHESVREYLLGGGLSVLDASLAENSRAKCHARLATWCRNCIASSPHRTYQRPDKVRFGFSDYAQRYLYVHCEFAFHGGALHLAFIDTIPNHIRPGVRRRANWTVSRNLLFELIEEEQDCLAEGLLQRQLGRFGQTNVYYTEHTDALRATIPYLDVNSTIPTSNAVDSTALLLAIKRSLRNMVQLLLECGADANLGSEDGTPLIAAHDERQCDIVGLLLDYDANPNTMGNCSGVSQTPLSVALARRCTRCVTLLLERGADSHGSGVGLGGPLTDAVSNGVQEHVRLLLARGADPDGSSGHRPLHMAVFHRDEAVVRLLLEAGANTKTKDEIDRTLLHIWCLGGYRPMRSFCRTSSSIAKALIDAGAGTSTTDMLRTTGFIMAAGVGSPSLVQLLIDDGADVNATNPTRETALMMATERGNADVVRLLIENNAKVNEADVLHNTALTMAVRSGVHSVVKILLDAGADVNATDMSHRTALVIAAEMGRFDIARLLVDRGAGLYMQGQEEFTRYLRLRIVGPDLALLCAGNG